jgi:hypothetical protein
MGRPMGSIIRVGACAFGASLITGCLAPAAPPSSSLARPQSAPAAPTARAQGGSLALVILRQSAPDARSREAGVDAIFDRSHGAHTCPELAKEQLCVLLECPAGLASATVFDAGAVTVTANEELTVERGDNGQYSAWIPRATLWSPGQPITVKVAGAHDNPPAFVTRLSGPGPITVLQPSGNDIVVERNRGLVVTWTKGVGQEVGLMLEPTPMRPRLRRSARMAHLCS